MKGASDFDLKLILGVIEDVIIRRVEGPIDPQSRHDIRVHGSFD